MCPRCHPQQHGTADGMQQSDRSSRLCRQHSYRCGVPTASKALPSQPGATPPSSLEMQLWQRPAKCSFAAVRLVAARASRSPTARTTAPHLRRLLVSATRQQSQQRVGTPWPQSAACASPRQHSMQQREHAPTHTRQVQCLRSAARRLRLQGSCSPSPAPANRSRFQRNGPPRPPLMKRRHSAVMTRMKAMPSVMASASAACGGRSAHKRVRQWCGRGAARPDVCVRPRACVVRRTAGAAALHAHSFALA